MNVDRRRCGQHSTYRSCCCEFISVWEEKRTWNLSQCQITTINTERMILTPHTMSYMEAGFTENSQGSQRDHLSLLPQPCIWVQDNYFSFKRCIFEWTNWIFLAKKKKKVLICSLFIKNLLLSYAKICHRLSQNFGSSLWSVPLNILPVVKLFE